MTREEHASDLTKEFVKFTAKYADEYKNRFGERSIAVASLNFVIEQMAEMREAIDILQDRLRAIEPTDGRSIMYHYPEDN